MIELIKALIKAKAEFQPIEKDKFNPHFKTKYASLDSVLDAVTPALCKYGLVIVQPLQSRVLHTHLYHESGEVMTSMFELPDISDIQKIGSALTYARRYSVCALLGITADEDNDGNAGKGSDKPASNTKSANQSALLIGDNIKKIREFLKVDKEWVINWLEANELKTIANLESPNQLINNMAIYWAAIQGISSDIASQSYLENVKSPDLASIQKWASVLLANSTSDGVDFN